MKKKLLLALMIMLIPTKVHATELHTAKVTWYCDKGQTATQQEVREGIVASKREWFHKLMIIWKDTGDHQIHPENFMGVYEVEDTGGEPIKKGYVVDIWIPDYDTAIQNGSHDIIFQIIDSEG